MGGEDGEAGVSRQPGHWQGAGWHHYKVMDGRGRGRVRRTERRVFELRCGVLQRTSVLVSTTPRCCCLCFALLAILNPFQTLSKPCSCFTFLVNPVQLMLPLLNTPCHPCPIQVDHPEAAAAPHRGVSKGEWGRATESGRTNERGTEEP